MSAILNRLIGLLGADEEASSIPVGMDTYPRFSPDLVDDVDVQRAFTALCTEFATHPPGSLSPADHDRAATVQVGIRTVLERQRQRALADEPLPRLDLAEFATHPEMAQAYERLLGNNGPAAAQSREACTSRPLEDAPANPGTGRTSRSQLTVDHGPHAEH